MNMIFKRKLPIPQEIKNMYPLDEKLALIKKKNDENIKKMQEEHNLKMLKETLREEVKKEILDEINKNALKK